MHVDIELKFAGTWHHYTVTVPARNYEIYGKIAGIYGGYSEEPIASGHGIPSDATFMTRANISHWGGIDVTWLTSTEIANLVQWFDEFNYIQASYISFEKWLGAYLFGDGFANLEYSRQTVDGLEDFRFIVWFSYRSV